MCDQYLTCYNYNCCDYDYNRRNYVYNNRCDYDNNRYNYAYNNCNNDIKNDNNMLFMFAADIGNISLINTEYVLLPYHSSNNDSNAHIAQLKPSSPSTVNGFTSLQLATPTICKQKIKYVSISIGSTATLTNTQCFNVSTNSCVPCSNITPTPITVPTSLTLTIYIYVVNNPLLIATANYTFTTTIKLDKDDTFVNKLQQVNINVPDMSYIFVSFSSPIDLNQFCTDFWLNVTMK